MLVLKDVFGEYSIQFNTRELGVRDISGREASAPIKAD